VSFLSRFEGGICKSASGQAYMWKFKGYFPGASRTCCAWRYRSTALHVPLYGQARIAMRQNLRKLRFVSPIGIWKLNFATGYIVAGG